MPLPTGYRRSTATDLRSRTTEPRRPRLRSAIPLSVLLALGACGGDDLLLPSSGQPATITILDGNDQTGTVGQALPESLIVLVTDPEERPVPDVEVTFTAPEGAALTPNDTVVTGADGRAAVYYTLATASGVQTVMASARPVVPSTSLTTTFSATAQPEAAVELLTVGGDEQEGETQVALPESLAVKVVDRFGNGVGGIEVVWSASDGAVSPETVASGADGRAATQRILGARPGIYRTSATVAGLQGSPVTFEATGIAPPSPQLVLVTEPSTSAAAGIPLERQPVLQLQDAVGAPLAQADVAVSVQISDGAGSLGGTTTVRSNAEGRVSFTNLSIRGGPGDRTLLFAAADFTPVTSGEIDVNPGPPAPGRSSASVPNGTAGADVTVTIRLEDEFGTEIEDAADAIRVRIEGPNAAAEVTVRDRGDGAYSGVYTPIIAGTDRVTVEVNGTPVGDSPFDSQVRPGPAAPSTTTADVLKVGAFFYQITVVVTTRDVHGNLRGQGGERVQIQVNGGGALRDAQDLGDGTYRDQFVTIAAGPTLVILLNGDAISGSPFTP